MATAIEDVDTGDYESNFQAVLPPKEQRCLIGQCLLCHHPPPPLKCWEIFCLISDLCPPQKNSPFISASSLFFISPNVTQVCHITTAVAQQCKDWQPKIQFFQQSLSATSWQSPELQCAAWPPASESNMSPNCIPQKAFPPGSKLEIAVHPKWNSKLLGLVLWSAFTIVGAAKEMFYTVK